MEDDSRQRAAIVVADTVPESLARLERLLERRYGADYDIVTATSGATALERLRTIRSNESDVALILADQWIQDMSGIDLLRASTEIFPDAKRAVVIGQGELNRAREAVLKAAALAEIETYIVRPVIEPDEVFYREISRFIQEWDRDHRPQPVAVRLIADEFDIETRRLYEALLRSGVGAAFYAPDSEEGRKELDRLGLDGSKPVAIVYDGQVIIDPTPAQVASALGANDDPGAAEFDVIIVGAGPAGLSAAVYGTSEGLSCLVVEQEALGGQASTSSMIRNYLGFPRGVTGADLASRAYWQAWFFGTRFEFGRSVTHVEPDGDKRVVTLDDGSELSCRTLILACGVSYRRIGIDRLEQLLGRGCFYGAPVTEAPGVAGHEVAVVGGGNSSAQTALFLTRVAKKVTLIVRNPELDEMSYYLVRDLMANRKIEIRLNTVVVDAIGDTRLRGLVLHDRARDAVEEIPVAAVFILIGAEPRTDWLPETIERDERGYVLTGDAVKVALGDGRRPLPLETTMGGVFACGDVRFGGMKRVAAAVGEGSRVIRYVHEYLAHLAQSAASQESGRPQG